MATMGFELSLSQAALLDGFPKEPVLRRQVAVRIPPDRDDETVSSAIKRLYSKYDVLRSSFIVAPGLTDPVQAPLDGGGLGLTRAVFPDLATACAAELAAPLSLPTGHVLRVLAATTPRDRYLVLTAAAAVADERSLALVAAELFAAADGTEEPLQFADYAAWEAEQRAADSADANIGRAFWLGLSGPSSSRRQQLHANLIEVQPPARTDLIASELDWLAAISAVAARHADLGDQQFVIGVAVDGRVDDELADAIGPYARFVDVIQPRELAITFAESSRRLAQALSGARRFSLHAPASSADWAFRSATVASEGSLVRPSGLYALEFVCISTAEGSRCRTFYDADRYSSDEAVRIDAQLRTLLGSVRAEPSKTIGQLPMIDVDELSAIELALRPRGRSTARPLPAPTIDLAFAAAADAFAQRPALVFGDQGMSYRELERCTARVAAHIANLIDAGDVERGPVGVLLDRGLDAVVAILAILRAGCSYVPLEPANPASRHGVYLAATGASLVLTSSALAQALPPGVRVLDVAQVANATQAEADPSPAVRLPAVQESNIAYLIFTSGSTGVPKAVAVTHANVLAYTAAVIDRLGITSNDRLAALTGISTDLGNTSLFPALLSGATLEIVGAEGIGDGQALGALIAGHGITAAKMTPSHLRALLAGGDVTLNLPLLVIGGEALDTKLVAEARAAGVKRVVNHYGPTETTVGALTYETADARSTETDSTRVPIGVPLDHVRAYIVDDNGQTSPFGAAGQLALAGAGVSEGYWGQPELTAAAFVPEPDTLSTADGPSRMYLTGDLVRLTRAGSVEFLRRIDRQVKVRGYRVELEEIEQQLRRQGEITEAVVLLSDVDELIAYLVSVSGAIIDDATLSARLATELPPYMVPGRLVTLTELPRTPSGKVDRVALADRAREPVQRVSESRAPANDVESKLLEIWRDVLPSADFGLDDNFFRVGGHSLLATKVIARARAQFGVELPLHAIFTTPTVALLAADISAKLAAAEDSDDELQQMLREIENLSDDEAMALLHVEAPAPSDDE